MYFKKVSDPVIKDEWNNKISQYSSKTIYHSYEWLEFIKVSQGLELVIYEICEKDRIIGYLPGFTIKKGPIKIFGSPFPGWTTPYMGPLINKDVSQDVFLSEFKKLMVKEGYHYAELSNRMLDGNVAKKQNFKINTGITYIADIKSTPEEILSNFKKSTRKHVRKTLKSDLIVEVTKSQDFITYYYDMLEEVFKKSNMKPTYSKQRVKQLIEILLPNNKILLTWVKYKNNIIACRIDMIDGTWMNSFGSASYGKYLRLNPNELARYYIMCQAAQKGAKYYDMTGGGTYKSKFGGEEITTYRIIYDRFNLYKLRNLAKKLIKLKNKTGLKIGSIKTKNKD